MKQAEYYIERLGNEKSFNLWAKVETMYYNIATLFFQDTLCGDQWVVSEIGKSVSYSESEIKDETESPLQSIPQDKAESLLLMKGSTPEEVAKCFEPILND